MHLVIFTKFRDIELFLNKSSDIFLQMLSNIGKACDCTKELKNYKRCTVRNISLSLSDYTPTPSNSYYCQFHSVLGEKFYVKTNMYLCILNVSQFCSNAILYTFCASAFYLTYLGDDSCVAQKYTFIVFG